MNKTKAQQRFKEKKKITLAESLGARELKTMSRYIKKCVGEGEITVVELPDLGADGGVSTRPVIPATEREPNEEESSWGTAGKRNRDVGDVELASFVELRSTRRRVAAAETNCASVFGCCSSSNASVEINEDRSTIADPTGQTDSAQLETLTFSAGIERSTTKEPWGVVELGNVESAEADSRHKQSIVAKIPSESDIEELFTTAESDLQKRFSERYNFDVVNGVPLEGRYMWLRVKPGMR